MRHHQQSLLVFLIVLVLVAVGAKVYLQRVNPSAVVVNHPASNVADQWIWENPAGGVQVVLNPDGTGSIKGGPDANFTWESQGENGFTAIVNWEDQGKIRTSRFFGQLSSDGKKLRTNWNIWGFGDTISTSFERL
jgi:hypothetical protein